ncbi:response regulator receiver sensor signal transduction histidine kinase [Candidatus Moduliflexus flocculans]|uniref:histidine kinase n=1 Tax=Candidatus Moduliflexus flocculans TaxID=1499966 RepID=A0A081BM89_9BACT|nr:response regulator receiver sensor signal transduction histidine kinase [Candidatus Moduliflexus flocculans]
MTMPGHLDNSQQPSILVVDDTIANLHFLTKLLASQNYTVRPVPEGHMAIASALAVQPDLILLDIMMPDMSGYEVCQRLKAEKLTQDIPIIFISVRNEILDKVKAFSIGGVDYITKPFEAEEVLARVKTHLALRRLQKMLEQKNRDLEQEIAVRLRAEEQLSRANRELTETIDALTKTQHTLVASEKMADLGQMMAGVAHELNSPLSAIRSASDHLQMSLTHTLEDLPDFFRIITPERQKDFFALLRRATQDAGFKSTKEKRDLRRNIEKLLSDYSVQDTRHVADVFVNLGIYDEDALSFLPLLHSPERLSIMEMITKLANLQKSAGMLGVAVEKAMTVIRSLKQYARYDQSGNMAKTDLTAGIDAVLTLYQNTLKQGIDVQRSYQNIPPLFCYPDELMQVWTNLIQNAVYAMKNQGTLTIDVRLEDASPCDAQCVRIAITDTGEGIPPEIQEKIFMPFFTTKPSGEGNGLGLDIVRKIIAKHQGEISVQSRPGQTTFTILLPIVSDDHAVASES